MSTKKGIAASVASALLVGAIVWLVIGEGLPFVASEYYVFSLGPSVVDLETLSTTAESEGFAVVEPAEEGATDVPLGADQLLVVDGSRFLLRVADDAYTYTVRQGTDGLELVFSPKADQAMDAVVAVLLDLQSLNAIGGEVDFRYRTYAVDAVKGPEPPADARIESNLYRLTVAEDWHAFAAAKGLTLVGLRVEVVAELAAGVVLQDPFAPYVESASDSLARLLLPIDLLVPLASTGGVERVRAPYEPVAP